MRAANFIQETTTAIAGTSGDGAVTLAQITGFPRISTALGSSQRFVKYVIQQASTNKMETGIGSVAANVLTRSKPQVTWDGTTWTDGGSTVTPLQFGATPTSGDVVVRLAPTAEDSAPTAPRQSSLAAAGDATWNQYPISPHQIFHTNGSGAALAANTEYYAYYRLDTAGALKGIQLFVNTAAGTAIKAALYDVGPDGLPGAKIVDFAGFPSAATGAKADTATGSWTPAAAPWLTPGWYVIGLISDGTPAILGTSGNGTNSQTPLGRRNSYGYAGTLAITGKSYSTGLPAAPSMSGATMPDPGASALASPWIGLKVTP